MPDAFTKFTNPISGDDGAMDQTEVAAGRNFDDDDGPRAAPPPLFDNDDAPTSLRRQETTDAQAQERANSRSVQKFVEEHSKPCV